MGDACDPDIDQDGILNEEDNCPYIKWDKDLDFGDDDGDGVGNECDNCPKHNNTDQLDMDRDDIGNVCDDNNDQDAMLDEKDTCPFISNSKRDDKDTDGIGDACDNCIYVKNPNQEDADDNGYGDVCDDGQDFDGDGVPDSLDSCVYVTDASQSNNDYGYEYRKRPVPTLTGDVCDNDMDSDRKKNGVDPCPYDKYNKCFISHPAFPNGNDADGDGTPDYKDPWYTNRAVPNKEGYFDFYELKYPFQSYTFDGKTASTDLRWKFDKDPKYSNEFYQLTETSSPFAGVTYLKFPDIDILGTWFVKGESGGNYIGFVFGFQNPKRFYTVMWRREHLTYKNMDNPDNRPSGGLRGLHIKSVHATTPRSEEFVEMLWHTGTYDTDTTLLWYDRNMVRWEFNTAYRWYLNYRPSIGMFELSVYQANKVIIKTGPILDNRILGGSFGVLAFDQPYTYWSNIVFHVEPRANRGLSLNTELSKIPLNLKLPEVADSMLVSMWVQIDTTAKDFNYYFNTTLLCTDTHTLCIRLVNNGEEDDNTLFATFGEVQLNATITGTIIAHKNKDKTAKWVNLIVEYNQPEYTLTLYVNNVVQATATDLPPQLLHYSELYLGSADPADIKLDELRILSGRIEAVERHVVVSAVSLVKYLEQGRLVVWYDMNEPGDELILLDKSGREQHTTLQSAAVRCPSKSEGYMYNIQYNTATTTTTLKSSYSTTSGQQLYSLKQFNNTVSTSPAKESTNSHKEIKDSPNDTKKRYKRSKFSKINTEL